MIVATKDGLDSIPEMFGNTYLSKFSKGDPDYWSKLHGMLYGGGRLRKFASCFEDIVEKFSFAAIARDQISEHETRKDYQKIYIVKYHLYSYIFLIKSFLDACAVFINETYGLNVKGSNIAFDKKKFISALDVVNPALTKQLAERSEWTNLVVQYRTNLIHKHGLYVGPIPTVPNSMTDPQEVDRYILEQPHYMPNDPDFVIDKIYDGQEGEFVMVTVLVDEWIDEAYRFLNLVLSSFTTSFELDDPNES